MATEEEKPLRREKYRQQRLAETPEERDQRIEKNRAYYQAYYQANKEAYAERHRRWKEQNPERVTELRNAQYERRKANGTARKHHLKSRYGITPEDEQRIWDAQEGCCAVCRNPFVARNYRQMHIDHDHKTGRVRGFLCINCNHGLGNFGDSIALLQAAVRYLST